LKPRIGKRKERKKKVVRAKLEFFHQYASSIKVYLAETTPAVSRKVAF
jgi:hypothetical protein